MDPLKVSAQFAAFVWFADKKQQDPKTSEEAARFAQKHWPEFLPLAHEGLGRLLLKIGDSRKATAAHIRHRLALAGTRQKLARTG